MKKFFAVILALAMTLAMGATVMAEENVDTYGFANLHDCSGRIGDDNIAQKGAVTVKDDVITISADYVKPHTNGEGMQGRWIGFYVIPGDLSVGAFKQQIGSGAETGPHSLQLNVDGEGHNGFIHWYTTDTLLEQPQKISFQWYTNDANGTAVGAKHTYTVKYVQNKGTITIANPQEDMNYSVYKIFDLVYNDERTAYSYTIEGDSPWFETINKYKDITLTKAPGTIDTYVVTKTDSFNAADFAKILNDALHGTPSLNVRPNGTISEEGEPTLYDLDLGYYFVTTGASTVCSLDSTNPDAVIYDKNEEPPFEKTVNDSDVELGQVITYTITGEVPPTTGYDTYTWKVKDEMSEGLTFNRDVKITIGGDEYTPTEGELAYTTKNGFELDLDMVDREWEPFTPIVITYTATVNEKAIETNVQENEATLTYSNDPTDDTSTATTPPQEIKVYTYDINIEKFKEGSTIEQKPLEGAEFKLYKKVREGEGEQQENIYYYKLKEKDDAHPQQWVDWIENKEDATTMTTGADGKARFIGLEAGDYFLLETKAPSGYNLLTDAKGIKVGPTGDEHVDISVKVPNSTGGELPSTGGIGTTIFYIVGGLLVAFAVVLLVTKRRMSGDER